MSGSEHPADTVANAGRRPHHPLKPAATQPGGHHRPGHGGSARALDFATAAGGRRENRSVLNLSRKGPTNMAGTLRSHTPGVALFLFLAAASGPAFAQQVRDRELRPAFDFAKIQMPVEILSVKLDGKDVRPGEKIKGDDDWLRGLSFTLKNISDKPVAYVEVALRFPRPQGFVAYVISYGVDLSRGEHRTESSPPAIRPGGTVELALTQEKYPGFLRILALAGAERSFDTAPYYVERICFEGEPDIIWAAGMLKRRDPNQPTEFRAGERYALPARQK